MHCTPSNPRNTGTGRTVLTRWRSRVVLIVVQAFLLGWVGHVSGAPPVGAFPSQGTLEYKIYLGEYTSGMAVGRARIRVETDGQKYRLRNEAELTGFLRLMYKGVWIDQSVGRLGPEGPQPLRYSEWRRTKPERWVGIDYDSQRVTLASGRDGMPLTAGTQDRLSVLWLLGMVARTSPTLVAPGQALQVPLLSFRGVRGARFESLGDEVLATDSGPLRTLHLAYRPVGEDASGIEVWLGYGQQMQPVRIRYRESSHESFDMLLER